MTEDASPENLRKFLKSDDPALVQMGLSMAKGAGVPDEMLIEILWGRNNKIQKTIPSPALARKLPIILPEIDYYYCFRDPTGKLT